MFLIIGKLLPSFYNVLGSMFHGTAMEGEREVHNDFASYLCFGISACLFIISFCCGSKLRLWF